MPKRSKRYVPTDVADWVEHLPDSFLACRDLGHTWRPYRAEWSAEDNAYWRELRCSRCHTTRSQWVSPSGHIAHGNAYTYPDGYTAPPGTGRMDGGGRDTLRLTSVLRLIEKQERRAG